MVYSNQQQNRYSIDNIIGQLPQSCYYHQCSCPATQVDPLSNVHFISKENRRHQRIPPPLSTNTIPINSPARSKRGTLSSNPDDDDFQLVSHQKKKNKRTYSNVNNNNQILMLILITPQQIQYDPQLQIQLQTPSTTFKVHQVIKI
ncbi:unnamed protein product [Rotaria sp. Silwood2]|nr:unnamed protein product [Rotaria sp. Silwood2]